ncbi:flagellar basal-body MS-ring/collar protein FliF [Candidatus Liberibacter sp.]|uniref:flagellar basal-body MS-ring/collar protein FliF n=1 Tax=Candidatus Liberibacter sp. TaxID=34022 RepID=UPI0015F47EED|nr:flagellar basal-body MS-ring/collar protein FliF [Candidatus Liberibacter sp.]MBA5723611.1 flagellar M-ring protein FliF [Candidatus Liberibacter sp.]
MAIIDQSLQFFRSVASLGRTRLIVFSSVIAISIGLLLVARFFVSIPAYESLYVKLEASDVSRISMVLSEANIDFRIGDNGSSILVPSNWVSKARLHLAAQGLPNNSNNSGYELFDKVNSFGLTSFMQEITRVRALEGEIARTIQAISGILAARVHIVMPDTGSFRRIGMKPTASVMIRSSAASIHKSAESIRYLVAAAVPGLDIGNVIVLDSTGRLLAAGDDIDKNILGKSLGIVQAVQHEIEMNIDKALVPFLGANNFQSAVVAELNTDTQQIKETVYDPHSRVERSVHRTKDIQRSESRQQDSTVTVEQNIPNSSERTSSLPHSSENSDKKEEQRNYEINTKSVSTIHNNYKLERLSIAVVINKGRLIEMFGAPMEKEQFDTYLSEISRIVSAAAGINSVRGDTITITSMDFLEDQLSNSNALQGGIVDVISRNFSMIINVVAFLVVVVFMFLFGIYALRSFNKIEVAKNNLPQGDQSLGLLSIPNTEDFLPEGGAQSDSDDLRVLAYNKSFKSSVNNYMNNNPNRRLLNMIEINEERFANILRKWAGSEKDNGDVKNISQQPL